MEHHECETRCQPDEDDFIYAGAQPTEQIVVTICQGTSGLDLTTVDPASSYLFVTRSDTTTSKWNVITVGTPTPTVLVLAHVFQLNDVPIADTLSIVPYLAVPGGFRRGKPFKLNVRAIPVFPPPT